MSPDQAAFLNQRHLPSRLTAKEAGWFLGFSSYDVTVLTSHKLLKPVGRPAQNSTKYYSTATLCRLHGDPKWLDRASTLLNRFWREKNEGRKEGETDK